MTGVPEPTSPLLKFEYAVYVGAFEASVAAGAWDPWQADKLERFAVNAGRYVSMHLAGASTRDPDLVATWCSARRQAAELGAIDPEAVMDARPDGLDPFLAQLAGLGPSWRT